MQSMLTLRRKLVIGVAGSLMTALSVVAVAPVGAADPEVGVVQNTSTIDTAAAISAEALAGPDYDIVYATAPTPVFAPIASVPFVTAAPITQLPGGTQVDNSVNRDMDRDAEAAQG